MERHFKLLSRFYLKAKSDQPTGPITKILNVVTYQLLGHSSLADKSTTVTRRSHPGLKKTSLTTSAREARDSLKSSSGRCIEDPVNTPPTKLEATKQLSLGWLKKESSPRLRSTRLPTAIMWAWSSSLSSGKTSPCRLTSVTHPQMIVTIAATRNVAQVAVDDRDTTPYRCFLVLSANFGLNRIPNLTFLGITWTSFWSKMHGCSNLNFFTPWIFDDASSVAFSPWISCWM